MKRGKMGHEQRCVVRIQFLVGFGLFDHIIVGFEPRNKWLNFVAQLWRTKVSLISNNPAAL